MMYTVEILERKSFSLSLHNDYRLYNYENSNNKDCKDFGKSLSTKIAEEIIP